MTVFRNGIEPQQENTANLASILNQILQLQQSNLPSLNREATQLLVNAVLDLIKINTDNLDVALSTRATEATLLTVTNEVSFKNKLLQVDSVGATTYLGYAEAGTLTSGATWAIKRIVETGNDVAITWADGTSDFDNIWNDRLTLTYN